MNATRASGGRRWRGRSIIGLSLAAFVLVAAAVIWRRGDGVARGAEIRTLDRERLQLEAQKTALARQIEEFGGRARLGTLAEQRLHMHVPTDSQVMVLPAPVFDTPDANSRAAP